MVVAWHFAENRELMLQVTISLQQLLVLAMLLLAIALVHQLYCHHVGIVLLLYNKDVSKST